MLCDKSRGAICFLSADNARKFYQYHVVQVSSPAGISFTAIISNCDNVIKVAHIVSTQKANRAAQFIARHIEVETPRYHFCNRHDILEKFIFITLTTAA